ncbi:MAG: hypothetical protein CVT77_10500 [Alphaproteobacteria bacterium HGW-Alphaproteobacteria-16]|nr:MAG: hypothetical protein CVT77_10500 [Alphaproteobacteria bacterium HGW-Alphaproteobacteria-16]
MEESGRSYPSLQAAVDAVGEGRGTIRIAAGTYDQCAVQEAGEISFVAAAPGQVIFDRAICEGKATLVLRGRGARVDGIVFMRTLVEDGNGAGIRIETGNLHVANSMFIDGQCGILSASDPRGSITIERSTFAGLGKDPTGNGAHAIYIGGYGSLKVVESRFERGTGGHYVKVRAPRVEILDSSFDDSQGRNTNYMIDVSNGANGRIAGNAFEQGPAKDNYSTMIAIAPEGRKHSSAGLVIEGNKAWLSPGFKHSTTFVGNWSRDAVIVRENELADRIAPMARR